MTNVFFYLYDTETGSCIEIKGYEEYLKYFRGELLPKGLGTRYLYADNTKATQRYHYRIVRTNKLVPKRKFAR